MFANFCASLYSIFMKNHRKSINSSTKRLMFHCVKLQVLHDLWQGKPWTESGHFPRVTLCDFEVRYLANLNRYVYGLVLIESSFWFIFRYTVQCCLLINIINEKVFAFLWCWYLLLGAITTWGLYLTRI